MTFLQMMLAVEEMQSQQRAENGVEEVVLGYYGDDSELGPDEIDMDTLSEFANAGQIIETDFSDLPEEIRDIVLAENHRLATGEVMSVDSFKRQTAEQGKETPLWPNRRNRR